MASGLQTGGIAPDAAFGDQCVLVFELVRAVVAVVGLGPVAALTCGSVPDSTMLR
jgi:hypothetical protein